jgi:hypothetical protein
MNKLAYILELIWLGLAIFCLGVGIYATVKSGIAVSYMFFILCALRNSYVPYETKTTLAIGQIKNHTWGLVCQ